MLRSDTQPRRMGASVSAQNLATGAANTQASDVCMLKIRNREPSRVRGQARRRCQHAIGGYERMLSFGSRATVHS